MQYVDFDITVVSKGDDGYGVEIASPAGEGKSTFEFGRSAEEAMSRLRALSRTVRGSARSARGDTAQRGRADLEEVAAPPTEIGEELFGALFTGAARSLFDQSLGMTRGSGLRLKLRIDASDPRTAWLAQLPWELLYRPETREYLNLSRATPLVRYLEVQRPFELLPFEPPLGILVVMASPEGVESLDLEKERKLIEKSWARDEEVDVDFLPNATVQKLSDKLAEGTYHVVHFMGHGDFDPDSGSGVLLFEKEDGRVDPVSGRTLGVLLRDEPSVRLVFLNACETAKLTRDEGQDPFAGVATALVMAGVPAVVAMQFPVSDDAAIEFSGCFYSRIVHGFPVDGAVAEGRKAVRIADADSLEWATPVLFMRSPDGVLFETPTPTAEAATAPIPEPEPVSVPQPPVAAAKEGKGKKVLWAVGAIVAIMIATSLLLGWFEAPPGGVPEDTPGETAGETSGGTEATGAPGEAAGGTSGGPEATGTATGGSTAPVSEPSPAVAAAEPRIVQDLRHGDSLIPASLRTPLRQQDFELASLEASGSFDSLGPKDVVVIALTTTNDGQRADLGADEVEQLRRHMEGGGGVLLAGLGWVWEAYEGRPIDVYPLNSLAEPYGIFFAADYVVRADPDDDKPRFTSAFMRRGHPAIDGVEKLFLGDGIPGSLILTGSAVPLVSGDDETVSGDGRENPVVIAAVEVGAGRLLCANHVDFFKLLNAENDGEALLTSALRWLSGRS